MPSTMPDHPDIDRMMRTGYPRPVPSVCIQCDDCQAVLDGTDEVFEWNENGKDLCLCEDCFEDRYINLSPLQLAEKFGITHYTVSDYFQIKKGD